MTEEEWFRVGIGLHSQKRWGAAAGCFARAGGGYEALTNLGWNQHMCGRTQEGYDTLRRALALAPSDGVVQTLLGQVLLTFAADGPALESARAGVRDAPDSPIAHVALAFALLFNGLWEEGWREYEWRYRYRPQQYPPRSQPLWRGERVERLWVEAEQGLGDTIFGLRWLAEAKSAVGEIIFYVQQELYAWIKEWVFEAGLEMEVLPTPRPLPEADAWCPLLSLPAAMGVGAPIHRGISYQGVPFYPDVPSKTPKRIGINWRGNPAHEQSHHRDIPLAYWLPLTEDIELSFQSFQYGGSEELATMGGMPLIRDRAPEITNFLDASRLLGDIDLLITVDTALAHLAGELGIPVWLLVNQRGADFRWGRDETTPWYPSMRIIRRGLDEDWQAVMARVATSLVLA